jgi:hypothetical protein
MVTTSQRIITLSIDLVLAPQNEYKMQVVSKNTCNQLVEHYSLTTLFSVEARTFNIKASKFRKLIGKLISN